MRRMKRFILLFFYTIDDACINSTGKYYICGNNNTMRTLFTPAIIALAIVAASCVRNGQNEPNNTEPTTMPSQNGSGAPEGYSLWWEDTFDGEKVDEQVWNINTLNNGGGNNELQYYTRDNVAIETDDATGRRCLVLTARREDYKGKRATSGRIDTQNRIEFTKGKVEAMIKLPSTYKGLWPTFWLMGAEYDVTVMNWPMCGEIDILEMGSSAGMDTPEKAACFVDAACHWGPSWEERCSYYPFTQYSYPLQDNGFHLFTAMWEEDYIRCYIDLDKYPDVKPYFTMSIAKDNPSNANAYDYFHKDFYVLLNLAVGGDFTGIHTVGTVTALNEDNGYSASMWVDYVRVYRME